MNLYTVIVHGRVAASPLLGPTASFEFRHWDDGSTPAAAVEVWASDQHRRSARHHREILGKGQRRVGRVRAPEFS